MGRKIEFNKDETLDRIIQEFWKNGFTKTSMSSIEIATNVKKTSLYSTFGDKENMFKLALTKYFTLSCSKNKKKGLEFIDSFFRNLILEAKSQSHSNGCLVMNTALELTQERCSKWKLSSSFLNQIKKKLISELKHAKSKKLILQNADINELGNWLFTQAFLIRELSKISSSDLYFTPIQNDIINKMKQVTKD